MLCQMAAVTFGISEKFDNDNADLLAFALYVERFPSHLPVWLMVSVQ
jgi:hypothetical protein